MPESSLFAPFAVVFTLLSPSAAAAQDAPSPPLSLPTDARAPSLALSGDAPPPFYRLTLGVDALSSARGRHRAVVDVAVHPALSFELGLAVRPTGQAPGGRLSLSVHAWPLARGLTGLFAGPVIEAALGGRRASARVGGEAGAQWAHRGALVGASVGGVMDVATRRWTPRVTTTAGYAWM